MPLVELVGPPAVGKTTLVAACVREGAADVRRTLLSPRHPLLAPLAERARRTPGPAGPRRALADRLLAAPDLASGEAALTAVASSWRPFLELVLAGPSGAPPSTDAGLTLAVMERAWLLDAIRLRALVATLPDSSDLALLDEGLTHPYKTLAAVGDDPARLERYAALVPLPDVLAVVDLDPDEHAQRLRARHGTGATRARWAALGDDVDAAALRAEIDRVRAVVDRVATAAATRGTPVVRIDATGRTPATLAVTLLGRVREALG